jgi:hypothetical protein
MCIHIYVCMNEATQSANPHDCKIMFRLKVGPDDDVDDDNDLNDDGDNDDDCDDDDDTDDDDDEDEDDDDYGGDNDDDDNDVYLIRLKRACHKI